MAAAIAYMKTLGFNRTTGNGSTQATHGSKSEIFTLEEKYTWLAVHYIQGYLADHLPLKHEHGFINDYSEIVAIQNPAEFLPSSNANTKELIVHNNWVIKEKLAPEIENVPDFEDEIRKNILNGPALNSERWIRFTENDFIDSAGKEKLIALFNYTSVHDSKEYISSSIDLRACIIEKGQVPIIKDLILNQPKRSSFGENPDRMHASPKTDTYSNPSDVVWMNWIDETEASETYYPNRKDEKEMYFTVASVTNNTINGETEIKIPSKMIRNLLEITEMDGLVFLDKHDRIAAPQPTTK